MKTKTASRGVIYARYSSDLQKDRSVDDQVALCRDLASREGITIIKVYADRAVSGTSVHQRDMLLEMLNGAKARAFDVVIIESIDRLSRDQADLHLIRQMFEFCGVEIRTLHEGIMDDTNITLRGLFAEMFIKQLGQKVKRGHAGLLREKKIPGAIPYGYRHVLAKPGEPEIHPEQAEIVQRIYREYAAGKSPRKIVTDLNAEGVQAPKGALWNHSTLIQGGADKTGMIGNPFYRGEIIWNRTKQLKNPMTGKKVKRAGNPDDLLSFEAPHLRIIDDELWEAANKVRRERSVQKFGEGGYKNRAKGYHAKSDSVLAGLLRCGCCGSHMVIGQNSRGGGPRMICSMAYRNENTCTMPQGVTASYDLALIEETTFATLRDQLSDPELFAEYIEAYHAKREQLAKDARRDEAEVTRKLKDCEAAIFTYMTSMEKSSRGEISLPLDMIMKRLEELEAERVGLQERLKAAKESINVVTLHPNVVTRAKESVEALHLRLRDPKTMLQARTELRNIIDHVVVHPTRKRMPYEVTAWTRFGVLFGSEAFPPMRSASQVLEDNGILYSDIVDRQKSVSS
jgi:site-specific DNA recombinase